MTVNCGSCGCDIARHPEEPSLKECLEWLSIKHDRTVKALVKARSVVNNLLKKAEDGNIEDGDGK